MKFARLPYISNFKAVFITVAVNLMVVFIFWPGGVNMQGVMADSVICACITAVIDIWFVYACLKKMRTNGQMPQQAPVSRLMQRLPKNPFALGAVYALAFAALMPGINWLILTFFDIKEMAFMPWLVYKLVYATVLSIKMVEFCIYRYVQPDWAAKANEEGLGQPAKNPFPRISLFTEWYGGVTVNLAMNILMGSVFGSVAIHADGSVVLLPTTIEGIPVTGLIFGLIMGVLITHGVVKSMQASILAANPAMLEQAGKNRRFTWLPKRKWTLMCVITLSVMLLSAIALPAVMYLFGKTFLNFFQFVILITLYAMLLNRPLVYVLSRRCMQQDYIHFTLKKHTV